MFTINGDILITSDWHFGLKSNAESRLRILVSVIERIDKFKTENKIKNIIFCGDLFHQRDEISVVTINVAIKMIKKIAKNCNVYLIIGNHDIFNQKTNTINSSRIFDSIKNVHLIETVTECSINGNKTLLVPWNTNLSVFKKNSYDMMFGHFDINHNFLNELYIERNIKKNTSNSKTIKELEKDDFLNDSDVSDLDFTVENTSDTIVNGKSCYELIGDWVEIVRPKGTIFSGHIHSREEFYTNNRKIILIGSPYQQTLNEKDSEDGFYLIDKNNDISFHKIEGIPIHVEIRLSDIIKNYDIFDYSIVRGNIVHQIHDVKCDKDIKEKIQQNINENKPYEELPTDLLIKSCYNDEHGKVVSINNIRKTKIEYLRDRVNSIDDKSLIEDGIKIERDKLFNYLKQICESINERN